MAAAISDRRTTGYCRRRRGEEHFFDMKIYRELIAAGCEVVFDVSEETGVDEFIGGSLESVAVNRGV